MTQNKSGTSVLADHRVAPSDQVVRYKLESVTASSHEESMSSEHEDGSVTDEDTGEENELPGVVDDVDNGSENDSSQGESTAETDTDSSVSEEFVAENMPGLEFNLDRGAAGFAVKSKLE